ncbi:MAG: hypothetical protein P1V20_31390 [Verrucomicrobiales bacterium]|nr:hypothetical protein [Verrucomicrobiales bacterium]
MNQLEHLKALRDKARVQTEQAKAVLKQQGEISESLDRLIEALESNENLGTGTLDDSLSGVRDAAMTAVSGQPSVPAPAAAGSLTEMITNLDGKKGQKDAAGERENVVWVEEEKPEIPTVPKPPVERKVPKLEPIVWEVAETDPVVGTVVEETGETEVAVSETTSDSNEENGDEVKFKFLKFGDGSEETATAVDKPEPPVPVPPAPDLPPSGPDDDTIAIDPLIVATPLAVPANINEEDKQDETNDEVPAGASEFVNDEATAQPEPVSAPSIGTFSEDDETIAIDPTLATAGVGIAAAAAGAVAVNLQDDESEEVAVSENPVSAPEPAPEVTDAFKGLVSSNIFFDANSAYLKDSELTKIHSIADAISGSESRIVKIQGLEDLASSNDFKVLLASRRILAVKKKLAEKGIEGDQIEVRDIQLSEDGRVLDPPALAVTAL